MEIKTDKSSRVVPAPVQKAQEALALLKSEGVETSALRKPLSAFALQLSKDGKDVTVEELVVAARLGAEHLASLRTGVSPAKTLTYSAIIKAWSEEQQSAEEPIYAEARRVNFEEEQNRREEENKRRTLTDLWGEQDAEIILREEKEAIAIQLAKINAVYRAAMDGKINDVRPFLTDKSISQSSLLGIAIEQGHTDIARLVLDADPELVYEQWGGQTALMKAAASNRADIARLLLDRGAKADIGVLFKAVTSGSADVVRVVLDRKPVGLKERIRSWFKPLINERYEDKGVTALMAAAEHGHTEVVRVLLERKAKVNKKDLRMKQSALMTAAKCGHTDIARLLLDHGANINATAGSAYTALSLATYNGYADVIELLLKRKANLYQKGNLAAFMSQIEHGCYGPVMQCFMAHGINEKKLPREQRKAYADYRANIARWQKVARQLPPNGLAGQDPTGFKPRDFAAVREMIVLEYRGAEIAAANTMAGAALQLFGNEQHVLQYLERWGKLGMHKQPLHDLIHSIQPPAELSGIDLKAWGDAALKCGPSMAKLFKFADRVSQPAKSADGKTWSMVKTRETAAAFSYKRGAEHPRLASVCFEHLVKEDAFEKALDIVLKAERKPVAKNMPDITIDGERFDMAGATFYRLPVNDVRGLFLGEMTACCQSIGGAGRACAEWGFTSKDSGFYVIEKEGKVIGQTWAWRGKRGELVFDSLETLGGNVHPKQWKKLVDCFADALAKRSGDVTAFHIGTGGRTPLSLANAFNKAAASPRGYHGYRDSHEQIKVPIAAKTC